MRQRHHDPIHYDVDCDAIEDARENCAARHKHELPACHKKNCGRRKRDQKMAQCAQRNGRPATAERLGAKQSRGDSLQESVRSDPASGPGDEGSCYVQDPADQTTPENGGKCSRFLVARRFFHGSISATTVRSHPASSIQPARHSCVRIPLRLARRVPPRHEPTAIPQFSERICDEPKDIEAEDQGNACRTVRGNR
jgi:hypothetical protein